MTVEWFLNKSHLNSLRPSSELLVGCKETKKIYYYESSGAAFTVDDDAVLATGNGGVTRFVSLPCIDPKSLAKAWVNFDGTTAANVSGTYSRTGTTVTVTLADHGHIAGHVIYADFTSGSASDGLFTIASVIDANTFTFTHGSSGSTSGNVTLLRRLIRNSYNIHSVSFNNSAGSYIPNFAVVMTAATYTVSSAHSGAFGLSLTILQLHTSPAGAQVAPTAQAFMVRYIDAGAGGRNPEYANLTVFE
jgi:hypothetical protein